MFSFKWCMIFKWSRDTQKLQLSLTLVLLKPHDVSLINYSIKSALSSGSLISPSLISNLHIALSLPHLSKKFSRSTRVPSPWCQHKNTSAQDKYSIAPMSNLLMWKWSMVGSDLCYEVAHFLLMQWKSRFFAWIIIITKEKNIYHFQLLFSQNALSKTY